MFRILKLVAAAAALLVIFGVVNVIEGQQTTCCDYTKAGQRVKTDGSEKIWLYLKCCRCWIPDPNTYRNLFPGTNITSTTVSDAELAAVGICPGATTDGLCPFLGSMSYLGQITGQDCVYLVGYQGGGPFCKMWVVTEDIMTKYNFNNAAVNQPNAPQVPLTNLQIQALPFCPGGGDGIGGTIWN